MAKSEEMIKEYKEEYEVIKPRPVWLDSKPNYGIWVVVISSFITGALLGSISKRLRNGK